MKTIQIELTKSQKKFLEKKIGHLNSRREEAYKMLESCRKLDEDISDHFTSLFKDKSVDISSMSYDSETAVPATTVHYYENRIKKGDQSIFHFQKVSNDDIKKYDLKQYPTITENYIQDAVIGDSSIDAIIANKKLQYINGLLGSKKEVRCYVLVFKNQPIEAAVYQEWLWSGGNMNELVVCIGVDDNRSVKWCKVFSWTTAEKLKADIREAVQETDTLNLTLASDYLQKEIDKQFQRRDFEEFSYITVDPPVWSIILTYFLTLLANFITYKWSIQNEYQ